MLQTMIVLFHRLWVADQDWFECGKSLEHYFFVLIVKQCFNSPQEPQVSSLPSHHSKWPFFVFILHFRQKKSKLEKSQKRLKTFSSRSSDLRRSAKAKKKTGQDSLYDFPIKNPQKHFIASLPSLITPRLLIPDELKTMAFTCRGKKNSEFWKETNCKF